MLLIYDDRFPRAVSKEIRTLTKGVVYGLAVYSCELRAVSGKFLARIESGELPT